MRDEPDYVEVNRTSWDRLSDTYQERHGRLLEQHDARAWGIWRIPESDLDVLGDVRGLDVLELGCGAARWSASLATIGARPIGLDVSHRQLEHARAMMQRAGVAFPLIEADAEHVPLSDGSIDVIFCDHGAFSVADPMRVMPECARLLRDGGLLAFCHVSPIADLAYDSRTGRVGSRLINDYFALDRVRRNDAVEFQLRFGEWIRLFISWGSTSRT